MQMSTANSSVFMEGFPKNATKKPLESESQLGAYCAGASSAPIERLNIYITACKRCFYRSLRYRASLLLWNIKSFGPPAASNVTKLGFESGDSTHSTLVWNRPSFNLQNFVERLAGGSSQSALRKDIWFLFCVARRNVSQSWIRYLYLSDKQDQPEKLHKESHQNCAD